MDCTFKTNLGGFNYRVGGIIINNKREILMCSNEIDPFYYTVGGRINLFETSEKALLREIKEETGLELKIDRLGFIHENFFELTNTNEAFHEICFYYYIQIEEEYNILSMSFIDGSKEENLHWISLDYMDNYPIYPYFLKNELLKIKNEVVHIVERKEEHIKNLKTI